MIHALFAAVLLAAAPEPSLEGLYAAIGGGGSLLIVPGDNTFGYDAELLNKDEIDDKALVGLQGVVKISHVIVHGLSLLNLDGFAPLVRWEELSPSTITDNLPGSEVA